MFCNATLDGNNPATTQPGGMVSKALFQSHFDRIRRRLEAEGDAARSFQHSLNKGLVREVFIREFLAQNISDLWGVGTGEIFDGGTKEGEIRNQIDVVIHNKRYPKLPLAAGIDLFLIESLSSIVEIKSCLTKEDVRKAASVARRIKSMARFSPQRFNPSGMIVNPRPYSFIFAYEGPAKIETVLKWMMDVSEENDFGLDGLRNADPGERGFYSHKFVDGVFVLGLGFVVVDSLPFESLAGGAIGHGFPVPPEEIWIHSPKRELEFLWAIINELNEKLFWNNFDMSSYLGSVELMFGV